MSHEQELYVKTRDGEKAPIVQEVAINTLNFDVLAVHCEHHGLSLSVALNRIINHYFHGEAAAQATMWERGRRLDAAEREKEQDNG